jgi:hypothetical protein
MLSKAIRHLRCSYMSHVRYLSGSVILPDIDLGKLHLNLEFPLDKPISKLSEGSGVFQEKVTNNSAI